MLEAAAGHQALPCRPVLQPTSKKGFSSACSLQRLGTRFARSLEIEDVHRQLPHRRHLPDFVCAVLQPANQPHASWYPFGFSVPLFIASTTMLYSTHTHALVLMLCQETSGGAVQPSCRQVRLACFIHEDIGNRVLKMSLAKVWYTSACITLACTCSHIPDVSYVLQYHNKTTAAVCSTQPYSTVLIVPVATTSECEVTVLGNMNAITVTITG